MRSPFGLLAALTLGIGGAVCAQDAREAWALRPLPASQGAVDPAAIDALVRARLRDAGLAPSPRADRATLIRRLAFDVLGLPPTPEEVEDFVGDPDPDAYERLVDRMLASPHQGERFARFWLDVVHYGDTHGFDKDKPRPNAWRYRDWVVQALNDDMPYARFVTMQLAGDRSDGDDGVPALGFIAAGPWDFVGHTELREDTVDKDITRSLDRDDMVKATLSTFCSTTVHCARCHDHKYDPIPSRDYYRLQAVFAGVDRADRSYLPGTARIRLGQLADDERVAMAQIAALDAGIARAAETELAPILTAQETARIALAEVAPMPVDADAPAILGWHSQIESTADVVKWVQVDLGSSQAIDGVVLVPCHEVYGRCKGPGFGFPLRYRVEIAEVADFTDSTTLIDRTAVDEPTPGDEPLWIDAGRRSARFVRVTATRLWERTADYAFALAELGVFDAEGRDLARGAAVTALDSIEMVPRWSRNDLTDGRSSRAVLDGRWGAVLARARASTRVAALAAETAAILRRHTSEADRRERARLDARLAAIAVERAGLQSLKVYAAATDFAPIGTFAPPHAIRSIAVLKRGDVRQAGEVVGPGSLSMLPALEHHFEGLRANDEGARRLALAHWVTDRDNPLTWRSIVNRVWQFHFGRGLVDTPNDFGRLGSPPSHPELLDRLAAAFRDSGGSLKALHRAILLSETWQQVVDGDAESARLDAGNRLLAHQNRRRLDAECFRDLVLSVSGRLDPSLGGPPEQQFRFEDDHSPRYLYSDFDVDQGRRRSLYRMLVRSVPDPFFEALDCADPSQLTPQRIETLTAPHALAIWNDRFVLRHCEHLAQRVQGESVDLRNAVARAFALALSRRPSDGELDALCAHASAHGLPSACRVILNLDETHFVD
ncbi:MAG: DUF1553 domain-containing protein [Planctomycetota bacterium]